jgi:hypothetical protein
MLTVTVLLLVASFVCCVLSAMGKCPLWVSVLLLLVAVMLEKLPR